MACEKAGLPEIGVHTLCPTYATAAMLSRAPIHVVSRNSGDSSIMITVDTYGHVTDDASWAPAASVSDALSL